MSQAISPIRLWLCELNKRIECGEFSECVDKECNWIGDQVVAKEVYAICAIEQMKQSAADKAKEKHFHSWSNGPKNNSAEIQTLADRFRAEAAAHE